MQILLAFHKYTNHTLRTDWNLPWTNWEKTQTIQVYIIIIVAQALMSLNLIRI